MNPMSDPTLHPDDADALDRLVEADYSEVQADPTGRDRRLAGVAAVLRRLDALPPVDPSADLTDRTLARIQEAITAEERALRVGAGDRSWWARTSRRVAAAAAVVTLGLVAVWPVQQGRDALDADTMRQETITAGFDASRWMTGEPDWRSTDLMPQAGSPTVPILFEGAAGYAGPVTLQARLVQRTIEKPDGTQVRVWQPMLVIVPLEGDAEQPD